MSGTSATLDASAAMLEHSENFERYVATTEYSGAAWSSMERSVSAAERAVEDAEAVTEAAIGSRQRHERRIGSAQTALDAAVMNAQAVAAQGTESIAVAAATGADLAVEGLGPTILGETLLTPEDLAAFSARRSGAAPSVDLLELARLFVLEGVAEGVRGDIAWAQSILETGNFGYKGSMVSTSDNNYAGIGACDSCSSGFDYATPQLGVRAQIQLLHTYADDNLTTADLAFPTRRQAAGTQQRQGMLRHMDGAVGGVGHRSWVRREDPHHLQRDAGVRGSAPTRRPGSRGARAASAPARGCASGCGGNRSRRPGLTVVGQRLSRVDESTSDLGVLHTGAGEGVVPGPIQRRVGLLHAVVGDHEHGGPVSHTGGLDRLEDLADGASESRTAARAATP
ncbi:MAG: glucosaminidase domain-containing protein [Microthrixaceae bacterium]|nr:glucosaminidase domain-containing protein [Microthrixaceae bacterium]